MSVLVSHRPLRLTPALAGVRLSPAEFDAVEDWDEPYTYELVQGILVVTPPPSEGERGPNDRLGFLLQYYKEYHPQGAALDLTLPEHLINTPQSRRRADRAVWTGLGRTPNVRQDLPTIAVEFVSAGRRDFQRDYIDKRDEYMAAGIQEYWIIDRFRRRMTVVQRGLHNVTEHVVAAHGTYATPLLPGFELPLGQLLAVADALQNAADQE